MSATQERRERAAIQRLKDAIEFAETYYPLPRCPHGNVLEDHAGDTLEPTCGCRKVDAHE
jgi:hypothetical protein